MKLNNEGKVSLLITWNKPLCAGRHGISGYFIYYRVKNKVYRETQPLHCCDHKIEKLQEGTDYEAYLVAVDSQGIKGDKSVIVGAKTGGKLELKITPSTKERKCCDYLALKCQVHLPVKE